MDLKAHWSTIYQTKPFDQVSWYQTSPETSMALIRNTGIALDAPLIDVGAGASTLIDHLLQANYQNLTVLDISIEALRVAQTRLGERAQAIHWMEGDVTSVSLPENHFALWHDRAVFHFLGSADARQRYVQQVARAVQPGGHVIVATFASDGPEKCSGLDVVRYDAASLHNEFGTHFELLDSLKETHITPWGSEQRFIYCYCRITAPFPTIHSER